MATTKKLTNTERIAELENQIETLKKEQTKLKEYEKFKKDADTMAIQMAIFRDSFMEQGFSDVEAYTLTVEALKSAAIMMQPRKYPF